MNRDQFIRDNEICATLERRGIQVRGVGKQRTAKCPFHEDKTASFSINVDDQVWHCHACAIGGSVIDLIAKFDGTDAIAVLKKNGVTNSATNGHQSNGVRTVTPEQKPTIQTIYSHKNEFGEEVYQVVRMVPKTFRQRHLVKDAWVWNMEDVTRVLYRLPNVLQAQRVIIVEGEKDADNLVALGFCATTNVGGAGKWLESYSESLAGKDVILCPDNDKPGKEHMKAVFNALAGKVKSARIIEIPSPHKDVSDFINANKETAENELERMISESQIFYKGINVPVFSMAELRVQYEKFISELGQRAVDLGKWLPTLGRRVRSIVPGDMVLVIADTGIGKTSVLMNIMMAASPMPSALFELELPPETVYERFMSWKVKVSASDVEKEYRTSETPFNDRQINLMFPGLYICTESGLTADQVEDIIVRSELKIGEKPRLVAIDYAQLLGGTGKRYEKASDNAERLRVIARRQRCVMVVASQVTRPKDTSQPITIHSGKDSGSLENSASLVLGIERPDPDDPKLMTVTILKNNKGTAWSDKPIECNYIGEMSMITERSLFPE